MKIHHIGILCDVKQIAHLNSLLECVGYQIQEMMIVEKFDCGCLLYYKEDETKIELVYPLRDSKLYERLKQVGSGTHHIAFEVSDIRITTDFLSGRGHKFLLKEPIPGVDSTVVNFILPDSGALFEIVQKV